MPIRWTGIAASVVSMALVGCGGGGGGGTSPSPISSSATAVPASGQTATATISGTGPTTVTVASGSSATIDGGVLPSGQTVVLSTAAAPTVTPPGVTFASLSSTVGLNWSGTAASTVARRHSRSSSASGSITLTLQAAAPSGGIYAVPVLELTDYFGNEYFLSPTFTASGNTFTATIPGLMVAVASAAVFFMASPGSASTPSPLSAYLLTANGWIPYSGVASSDRVLILTHGIFANVQDAFPCAAQIQAAGGYDDLVGINYDWTQPPSVVGPAMAQFFNGFAGQRWVDVEAHSYGAVVAVAGLNQSSLRPHNLILLGGPLSGTPIANAPYLFTALMNGFFNGGLVSPNTVSTFLSSGAAAALAPGAPSTATQTFAAEQPQTNVIKVGGSSTTLATVIAEFFTAVVAGEDPYGAIALATQPNDGIVPLSSAEASLLPGITLTYPLSHTQLTCTDTGSTTVVSDVAAHLERPTPSP